MQTVRQAFTILKQNPLLSTISILGTAFAITMIMAIVIIWQTKYADLEPVKTLVLYDKRFPSVFVDEFLHPEKVSEESYVKHPNANKRWTRSADQFLLKLHNEGKSVKYIANKMPNIDEKEYFIFSGV